MLTPQEVSEHAFAKASFGGYNMAMVDEFLDTLTEDYTALYKENAALKAKMKVLVDKLEEYRSTEDAMRKALLTAQSIADDLVKEAEKKKAEMITSAEIEAREQVSRLRQEVINEETRLTAARNATALYVAKVRELHQKELECLDGLDTLSATVTASPKIDPVAAAVADIESNMGQISEVDPAAPAPGAAPAPAATPEDDAPTRRIDLNDLQFGKDFELK